MSPVNSDDSSGSADNGAGRPLTRRELRAREKSQGTGSNSVIPEQAYQTGQDIPAPAHTPAVPAAPVVPPTVQMPAPEHSDSVQDPGVPDHPNPEPDPYVEPPEDAHREDAHDELVVAEDVQHEAVHPEDVHHEAVHPEDVQHEAVHHEAVHPEDVQHEAVHPEDVQHEAVHHEAVHHEAVHPEDVHHEGTGDGEYAGHHAEHAYALYDDHPGYHEAEPAHEHSLLGSTPAVELFSAPSKKVRRRRRFVALLITLTVFVAAIAVGAQFLKPLLGMDRLTDFPGPGTGQVHISVLTGEGPRSIATKLETEKVIANADTFAEAFATAGGTLAPGDYTFRQEMKNSDAVAVLLGQEKGKVMYFALNAGLRITESLEAISEGSGIPVAELKALSDSASQFGVPAKAKNLEGFLAPGEYRFPLGTAAKDILQALVKVTLDELKAQGITEPAKRYDAIIVASIVQAEGGQAEYGDVAGAIYNRLKPKNTETNGLIQSDATVTYGLGRKSFHIDENEKADKSNPYNTYANTGLPVGPIGSPGKTAIDAAAKPKANDYLYWVTINLDTKETKFSKTLAQHNVYVAQYNSWCDAHAGRCV
ncbi:endolytic transglycosylase MltG [Micrococcaceae bacterium Sec5.7]